MFRNNYGNAIAQYSIIIILIAVACYAMYAVLGSNIVKGLTGFSSALNSNQKAVSFTNSSGEVVSITPGELGGSSSDPVSECNGDTCVIDFGDYVLNGIPANFSDESVSSRGNDDLTNVMSSMIQQLEAENNPPDQDLSDLIALIKDAISTNDKMSDAEEIIEIGAFDVYVRPPDDLFAHPELANELSTYKMLLNNIKDNKMIPIFASTDPPLINMPAVGETYAPTDVLFPDMVWRDENAPYKSILLNSTQLEDNTSHMQDLKTAILDKASECGKSQQAEIIAYLIDISTKVSTATVDVFNKDEEVVKAKAIVDHMDIDLASELINLAKGIDPSLGGNPIP
ncbi:MAG: hypothetical protein AB7V50_01655 [Vampirovibrionia bacterium]